MKQIMDDIERKYIAALKEYGDNINTNVAGALYIRVQKEVYQEYLSTMMERNN